jgi:serine/threonine-protein kinase
MVSSSGYSGASVPENAEEARAFYQARLGAFSLLVSLIGGGFFVLRLAIVYGLGGDLGYLMGTAGARAHAITVVLQALAGAACARGKRTRRELLVLDAAVLVGAGIGYSFVAVGQMPRSGVEFVLLLIMSHTLIVHSAVVPSPASRTLMLGAAAMAPTIVQTWFLRAADPTLGTREVVYAATNVGAWAIATVISSTLISRRIYGLQRQVAEARRLGQYTLEEKVGEGGMGEVYRASHALLRRPTAIKLLRTDGAGERALKRFEREVQLTSQLTHPNTIQIYDFGHTQDGRFYYAMEYLEGITLEELVELDGPQPAARVVALVAQVCGSLAEAHAVGLIHRDVKPANLMLCERGRVADVIKVLDFGLVKSQIEDDDGKVSRTDAIVGTPTYLAPESILRPDRVDARADLYAVGAVAYFLLTGRDVFEGTTVVEVCASHLHTKPEPPSARLGAPVPADLEGLVMSCLAKSPADRPASAEALRRQLLACVDANGWSDALGHDWWEQHRAQIRERRSARPATKSRSVLATRHRESLPDASVA